MPTKNDLIEVINKGYSTKGDSIILGAAMFDEETLTNSFVKIPLKTINRHGLIAGATGTGKTKTLQIISEQLSEKGVPVLLMDVKGDLSGNKSTTSNQTIVGSLLSTIKSDVKKVKDNIIIKNE